MKARGGLAILVCALVALSVPAAAAAQPGYTIKPKSLHLELNLPASNGYSATISTEGHRQVVLNVSKGYVFARYTALGKVSRKGIEADFGTFGHVSLRFRSKRRYHPSPVPGLKLPDFLKDRCKGRRTVAESGVFLGNVRFEGEHGFTRVKASRSKGKVVRSYRRVCKPRSRSLASKIREENVFIAAQAKRFGVTRFLLTAAASLSFRDEKFAFTFAIGGEKEKDGRVAISRGSILFEERNAIVSSPLGKTPVTAKVKLPKPFEGTATYLEEGSSPPSWTGDIGVRLPGGGLVPLAGPEFEAELCRGDKEAFRRCLDSFEEKVQLSYGSGSHSQPLALARLSSLR